MKFTKVFTSFLIIILNFTMFNTAYANSIADSGWNITSSVVTSATTTFNATKTKIINGASVAVTGVAKITPTGPQVGKFILRTGVSLAVTIAVQELLGAVDWVLDPANSAISYLPKQQTTTCDSSNIQQCSSYQYVWMYAGKTYSSPDCLFVLGKSDWWGDTVQNNVSSSYVTCTGSNTSQVLASFTVVANPNYDSSKSQDERKSLPLDVVGGRIVQDAAQDQAPARDYTGQVANTALAPDPADQIVPPAELIGQFEGSAAYPSQTTSTETTTTTNPDGTTQTDKKDTTYPAACAWMPSVCEFASNAIDFMKPDFTEPDAVDTPTREIPQQSLSPNLYNYGSSCPADRTLSMNIVGRPFTKTFSFSEICSQLQVLSNLVMAGAYVYGALIIARGV